jgi:hypothetical protein
MTNFSVKTLFDKNNKPFAVLTIIELPVEMMMMLTMQMQMQTKQETKPTIENSVYDFSENFHEPEVVENTKKFKSNQSNQLKFNLTTDLHIYEKSERGIKKKEEKVDYNTGSWTPEEHEGFIEGYEKYGRNWSKIAKEFVPTR